LVADRHNPPDPALKTPLRLVLVTMDTHLASACERARAQLVRQLPGLQMSLHAASEFAADAEALARCTADIAAADIVVVTMLFMEDHFQPVLQALQARRDHCDAMVCAMSAGEVARLTRMGKFDMGKPASGVMALLKKLRGKAGSDSKAGGSGGEKQMRMLRRLPQLLRYIPGTAQDVRAYFLTLQYWLGGSQENVANLVRFLIDRYAAGPREVLRGKLVVEAPVSYPEVGVYHPRLASRMAEDAAALPEVVPAARAKGRVGLLLLRSYLLAGNARHYDGMIAALEVQGLQVVPAFAAGLDARPAIERFFMHEGRCTVDAVLSLTGFSLVGGPAYNDSHAAEEVLSQLDVPYLAAHAVEFQSLTDWGASERGLLPVESTIMVAIPELDGATGPAVFGGRGGAAGSTCTGCENRCHFPAGEQLLDMHTCCERTAMLASRVAKLVALRRTERATRKLAMVVFNFPPNAGNLGTAAHLSVFESVYETLKGLQRQGYTVELPTSVDALRDALLIGNAAQHGADANVHTLIPPGARRPAGSSPTAATSSCWACSAATCSSACSPAWATKATRCGCCSNAALRPRTPSAPSTAGCAKTGRPTRCCTSARMAHSSSCPASRPASPVPAGPTGSSATCPTSISTPATTRARARWPSAAPPPRSSATSRRRWPRRGCTRGCSTSRPRCSAGAHATPRPSMSVWVSKNCCRPRPPDSNSAPPSLPGALRPRSACSSWLRRFTNSKPR
jgi:magnesium chelatase subunit H